MNNKDRFILYDNDNKLVINELKISGKINQQ